MEFNIMVEGQDGLSWPRWQRIVSRAEELGFTGIYRSDHLARPDGTFDDDIETWISLGWAAGHTQMLHMGTNVSPISFRNPVLLAWQANSVAALSGGRVHLGVGAGWQEFEHTAFGFDLLDLDERFARYEEGIQVIRLLTQSAEPVSFAGHYYRLDGAMMQPRSPRADGIPLTIGGNGPKRTLPLVAKYADEWNGLYLSPEDFRVRSTQLDQLLTDAGRDPKSVRRTHMSKTVIAEDDAELRRKTSEETIARAPQISALIGTAPQLIATIGRLQEAGADGIMMQLSDVDDTTALEVFARDVMPQFR